MHKLPRDHNGLVTNVFLRSHINKTPQILRPAWGIFKRLLGGHITSSRQIPDVLRIKQHKFPHGWLVLALIPL